MVVRSISFFLLLFLSLSSFPQKQVALNHPLSSGFPYQDSTLRIEERIKDLLSRMTVEEKFWQLFMIPGDLDGGQEKFRNGIFGLQISAKGNNNAVGQILRYNAVTPAMETARKVNAIQRFFTEETRLGIPIIPFEEALHGLLGQGATVFPQAIGLAATWDTAMMGIVAKAIARETRSRGIRQVLSPVVNIANDVRWGRVEESYGEDPFLAAAMGVAFVSAFEKLGVITTPKHFLANSGDGGRDSYPVEINERLLEELYLPPFRACIDKGGSRSVMTSYNALNGSPCTANKWLLNKKLKRQMNFHGFVISDACAVGGANVLHFTAADYPEASANAINKGLDVIFQTEYDHYKLFIPPFLDGRISMSTIDSAVCRVLRAKFELGLFDHPYTDENETVKWNDNASHRALAKEAALKSVVLLKNDPLPGQSVPVLPLDKSISSLAVIGTDAAEARLGGYSGPGNGKVSILDGIRSILGKKAAVTYTPGCGRLQADWAVIPSSCLIVDQNGKGENGLMGEYFNNTVLGGSPVATRIDKELNFRWTLYSPHPDINFDFFSARWTGRLKAPETGNFRIGIDGNDGYRLFIDGKLIIDNWKKQTYNTSLAGFYFEKDKTYDIKVEFFESSGGASLRLIWNVGVENDWPGKIEEAVTVASKAEAAIVVAGIEEGESRDRAFLSLPGHQEEMIRRIAATGKPVVVILVGGSAITMTGWIDSVASILDVWYPGEEGGNALAEILFGDYNPAGRLPITFPRAEGQLPLAYHHKPTGRNDDYSDLSGEPLFPFGYGLSYTNFEYSGLSFDKKEISASDAVHIFFRIRNTGTRDGDEVVQLYIRDLLSSVTRPVKELKGFQRIHLRAGELREVSFRLTPDLLKMLNENMEWIVEPGDFRIMIGTSSTDIRLRDVVSVK